MQIIIPMSGFGERFRRAGYALPKPLIEIEGKPIVAHVIDMFPGETEFVFVCNQDHLDEPAYSMEETLRHYCPTGRVLGIAPHKLGPVHAVLQATDLLDPARPVVVNYCDFTCYWDWAHFKDFVAQTGCAGAIPAYRGFHPHTLGSTNYAYMREQDGWAQDIQEKQPYTDDRMQEYASSGSYYFRSAALMRSCFEEAVRRDLNLNGEFYVSLTYKPLFQQKQAVAIYPLQHFMQWGTPEDVAEYTMWSSAFRGLLHNPLRPAPQGSVVVPMAGLGKRFADEGYALTKPLIPVSGRPMVVQATHDLPLAREHAFVLRADMPGHAEVTQTLLGLYPNARIRTVAQVTEGQACTALLGLQALREAAAEATGSITIGACDNGALYDPAAFEALAGDPQVDVIVWGVRGYANAVRRPHMYGWLDVEGDRVRAVSVKTPLADPKTDPVVIGTFTFRRAEDFERCLQALVARDGRINGEFYIDALINDAIAAGLDCRWFEIDSYLSWGTPADLRTFEYWQSCLHKWPGHPYRLEHDARIPVDRIAGLDLAYRATVPAIPARSA